MNVGLCSDRPGWADFSQPALGTAFISCVECVLSSPIPFFASTSMPLCLLRFLRVLPIEIEGS